MVVGGDRQPKYTQIVFELKNQERLILFFE
jgi:hypothetical protein